jgi:Circadian oscillating protein COP23
MKFKTFSPIFAAAAIAFSATSALGGNKAAQTNNFYCANNNGSFSTMVKNQEGGGQPIFNWNSQSMNDKALPKSFNAQQLCQDVSAKLNNHIVEGKSIAAFIAHQNKTTEGVPPMICAKADDTAVDSCNLVLFSLEPGSNSADSHRVLNKILDQRWRQDQIASASNERGVQALIGYKVDIFKVLGMGLGFGN